MVHDASFPTATNVILEKRRAGSTKVTKREGAMEASDLPNAWIFHEAHSYFPYYEFFQITQNTSIEFMMC